MAGSCFCRHRAGLRGALFVTNCPSLPQYMWCGMCSGKLSQLVTAKVVYRELERAQSYHSRYPPSSPLERTSCSVSPRAAQATTGCSALPHIPITGRIRTWNPSCIAFVVLSYFTSSWALPSNMYSGQLNRLITPQTQSRNQVKRALADRWS
jgi:hypothetical protein